MKLVKSSEVPWVDALKQGRFQQRRRPLGGERVKFSVWELPAGKKSFPLHAHQGTEEGLYVLSGTAKVRTPEGETRIGAGDFVSFPAGSVAHQLINDTDAPLTYLAWSASLGVDVVEYPDSGKVACAFGEWPNMKRFVFDAAKQANYFDGEDDA